MFAVKFHMERVFPVRRRCGSGRTTRICAAGKLPAAQIQSDSSASVTGW
jgi:hypothetical protein